MNSLARVSAPFYQDRFETNPAWKELRNPKFLPRRHQVAWKRRNFEAQLGKVTSSPPTLLKQSLEVGLFGAYFLVFLASLWFLG